MRVTSVESLAEGAETPIGRRRADLVELPLSALQQRIWFLCTSYAGDASPILFHTWRIRGPLVLDAWTRAIDAVVNRHESLRTLFPVHDGVPVQVIAPPAGLETELIDLGGLPEPERDERAREILVQRTHALLDLVNGPLIGSCLVRLADDHHLSCFTMHHLLADGTSLGIVGREIRAGYQAFRAGTEPVLPELPMRYGDFAVWQHTAGQREAEEVDLRYWREQLAGVPPLELRAALPRPAEKGTRSAEVSHPISGDLANRLAGLARSQRCTLFMVLLAALQALLAESSGQEDFCVGTPIAGRTRVEMEPLVGLFANTLPLRADLSGDPTFRELLIRTRGTVIDALDRQTVPFGRVVTALDLPHNPGRTQVFQVIFSMHTEIEATRPELAGLSVEGYPVGNPKILHDMVIDVWPLGTDSRRIGFRYDTALFTAESVATLARRFEDLLVAVADNPLRRLSELAGPTVGQPDPTTAAPG